MPHLNDYLDPVSIETPLFETLTGNAGFPHNITVHTDNNPVKDLSRFRIAILGVPDGRNSPDHGSEAAPDAIRKELYRLAKIPGKTRIIDLGNMKKGSGFNDTLAGLADIISILLAENVFPVIVGGSSALVPAIDRAFTADSFPYTLISVDSRIDYSNDPDSIGSLAWLNRIFQNHKSTLGHFINTGFQTYLNDQQVLNRFARRHYELVRIGDVRQAISLTEPLFRDAHAAVFDISAVRQSDAPGTAIPSPNGFYGEEICLLSRYAGISDNLKIFGLFDMNPGLDTRSLTAGLSAQIIWFFLEGFSQRQYETGVINTSNSGRFIRYHVRLTDLEDDMVFVKSTMTDRWWLEMKDTTGRPVFVACSNDDYLKANRNEVPDRWVVASNRLKS